MTTSQTTTPDSAVSDRHVAPSGETMKALVLKAPNDYRIDAVAVPIPSRNEVLCRVRSVAICGTDAHLINGDYPGFWPPQYPFVPGHEWSGEVVALGEGVEEFGWRVGDRVAGSSHAGCGYCRKCQRGSYNLCEQYGNAAVHAQYGHTTQGAFAEYVVHSIKSLTPIPAEMEFDVAAMLDTTSIALHTVNRAGLRVGDNVAVIGSGVMGLLLAECAHAAGAGRTIMVGRGARLRRAAALGYETVDSSTADPVAAVRALTSGVGVEVALESAGAPETIRWSVDMLRKGGCSSIIGIPLEDVALPIQRLVLDELRVVGTRANAGEMADAVPLVASGRVRAGELITHRFDLSDFAEALRVFRQRLDGALKVIIHP